MIALHPADFAGGAKAPDGSGWQIGDDFYATNPRLYQTDGDRAMVRLWSYFRGGGMGGPSFLPSTMQRESALMLDAFAEMDAALREFQPKRERE